MAKSNLNSSDSFEMISNSDDHLNDSPVKIEIENRNDEQKIDSGEEEKHENVKVETKKKTYNFYFVRNISLF
jgi:hypothetical protein